MSAVFICPLNESPWPLSCLAKLEEWESKVFGLIASHPVTQPQDQQWTNDPPSLGIQKQVACYARGWISSDRFAETNKMVACVQVIRIPALTTAFKTAKWLNPAPSFCFPKGVGLSASSITSLPACKWCTLGFLRVLTPCSPIPY